MRDSDPRCSFDRRTHFDIKNKNEKVGLWSRSKLR